VQAAVDQHGHAALALHAAHIDVDGAAVAAVAHLHAGHALEDVGRGGAAEALDLFAPDVHRGGRREVGPVGRVRVVCLERAAAALAIHAQGADLYGAGSEGRRCADDDGRAALQLRLQATAGQQLAQRIGQRMPALQRRALPSLRQARVCQQHHAGLACQFVQRSAQRLRRDLPFHCRHRRSGMYGRRGEGQADGQEQGRQAGVQAMAR
jgi:hypothetical protein